MSDRPRLLYLITEDWYFLSHRLDLARAARMWDRGLLCFLSIERVCRKS